MTAGPESVDYIIVGAGSAGCVLANRLTEDPDATVLLLEAGKPDRHLWLRIPIKFRDLALDKRFNWGLESEPEPHMDGRAIPVPRGKVLGGSSSINGMIYARGHPADFDQWAQTGLRGWSYADVLPYFRRSETFERGEDAYHGGAGPLSVSRMRIAASAHHAYMEAAKQSGFPLTDDLNGAAPEGFGPADYTIGRGRRASTARAFLRPALARPGLRVETGALVARVLIEHGRAVGVELRRGGRGGERTRIVRAAREVILAGGAYASPQLLMLSGIGPAEELRAHGIAIVHDAPGVGRNLQDHVCVSVGYPCTDPQATFDREVRLDRLLVSLLRWGLFESGPLTSLPLGGLAFVKTRPELDRPDIEFLLRMLAPTQRIWLPGLRRPVPAQLGCVAILLHPDSRGTVTLRSADPADKPRIVHNYFAVESDLATLRAGLEAARALFTRPPLKRLVGPELFPGEDAVGTAALEGYIRRTASTIFHPVGTCRMGEDPGAVVDGALRVRGVEALRVVDASVMPTVPGGHTNAPTIMIAEKAADLIRDRAAPARAEI